MTAPPGIEKHDPPPVESIKALMAEVASRCPEGKIPDQYVMFDTETTSQYADYAIILQYAFVTIIKREPSKDHPPIASYVAHPRSTHLPQEAININGLTHEKIASGHPPAETGPVLISAIEHFAENKLMVAGHNICNYDYRIVRRFCDSGKELKAGTNMILDSGILVKAAQLGLKPHTSETLEKFYERIGSMPRRVKWSLDRYCYSAFELYRVLPKDKMHDAVTDCLASHYVLEALRKLGGMQ